MESGPTDRVLGVYRMSMRDLTCTLHNIYDDKITVANAATAINYKYAIN